MWNIVENVNLDADLKIIQIHIKPEIRTSEFDVCSQKVRSLLTLGSQFVWIVEGFCLLMFFSII